MFDLQKILNKVIYAPFEKYAHKIPDNSIDLIHEDVPYGVNFSKGKYNDTEKEIFSLAPKWAEEQYRILKEHHHCYVYVPVIKIHKWIDIFENAGFRYNNKLTLRSFTTNNSASIKNNFTFETQDILYLSKGKAKDFNRIEWIPTSKTWFKDKRNKSPKPFTFMYPSVIEEDIDMYFPEWKFPKQKMPEEVIIYYSNLIPKELARPNIKPNKRIKLVHPNQKNVDFAANLIKISSNKHDIVFDPYCGSGSSGKAGKQEERNIILGDKTKDYAILASNEVDIPIISI